MEEKSSPSNQRPIRWRKGGIIGCGAFGQVYMGLNLDTGEFLAVKEAHVMELEAEVKLLKNLSHPNIVRYLGTVREEETLNILMEFVPGGSISALLGKFGPFPEAVIKTYTKQLLLGLEYLHKNGIIHRDIKGANILVDNKGCIKLTDFGASKRVVDLAGLSGAKSMKGTPYWMAPEVILQTGHSFSADIWSVGCTVVEMATGKPPWSDQYQEVAALFYNICTAKSHPLIPEHISDETKDFLQQCLQKGEPGLRPSAHELLQHPFISGNPVQSPSLSCTSFKEESKTTLNSCGIKQDCYSGADDLCNLGSLSSTMANVDKHMQEANRWKDEMWVEPDTSNKSFSPMCELSNDWTCKVGKIPRIVVHDQTVDTPASRESKGAWLTEDGDELIESKIRAFLDEEALELKKLQLPLYEEYEEFYNSLKTPYSPNFIDSMRNENSPNFGKLERIPVESPSAALDSISNATLESNNKRISNVSDTSFQSLQEKSTSQLNNCIGFSTDAAEEQTSPSVSDIQKKWKEELDQELERSRERMRQVGATGKSSSPIDRALNRTRDRSRFSSPGK